MNHAAIPRYAPRLLKRLFKHGWAFVQLEVANVTSLGTQLFDLATTLGTPQSTRSNALMDRLIPQKKGQANPKSLSSVTGLTGQPWHVDLAHFKIPAHYIVLMCERKGSNPVATELVYWKNLIDIADYDDAHTEPFLVRNGKSSFYATMLTYRQEFIRYDPGCMQPMTLGASTLMKKLSGKRVEPIVRIDWRPGLAVIIDNWRLLHRRLDARGAQDRVLLRVSVTGDNKK